ncbi:hypothetical protein [Chryseobacterium sp. Bi04]|uniref:hypothetical protein n=1 Tax=Chryseobacterium sp. Bi04 TaxID=2822345 RepID=UPI001D6B73E9|nr:hypothetical protein [Chryseobacterium sp. Bi04]CAH0205911.1 hypothetical protein SRABI04_02102 [Chryseobacterium sp. Bi04]
MKNKKFYFNKKYHFYDKDQNILLREDQLVGKKMDDLDFFFSDYQVQKIHTKECVFVLRKSFFGLFKLKLYLYLDEDTVYDYDIKP